MRKMLRKTTFALGLLGAAALLTGPSFALESGVETPAWPELLTPHADLPNFQLDETCCASDEDQTIVDISPEGKPVFAEPDNRATPHEVVIMPDD
jgi:hypothetical protein